MVTTSIQRYKTDVLLRCIDDVTKQNIVANIGFLKTTKVLKKRNIFHDFIKDVALQRIETK
jgi:adenylate cyclase class IV